MDITLNESWISGKYSCGVIDTSLGTPGLEIIKNLMKSIAGKPVR